MTHQLRNASRVVVVAGVLLASSPVWAQEYTLKVAGIAGTSQVLVGAMDLQSFSWAVQNPASMNRTDLDAGRPVSSEVFFNMMSLKELPSVFLKIVNGEAITDAQLAIWGLNTSTQKFDKIMEMKFDSVMLTSLQIAGTDGRGIPTHTVSMSFMTVEICVFPITTNPCRKYNFAELK